MAIDFSAIDKKKILILGGAILAGLGAVVLTNNYIKENVDTKLSEVAGKTEQQVREVSQQLAAAQKQNQDNIQRLYQMQEEIKKSVAAPAQQAKAQEASFAASLSSATPAGKRALTINMDVLNAVGGLVKPSDSVDILIHLNKPGMTDDEKITLTLFQNVKVIAVGQSTGPQAVPNIGGKVPITFALNPQEANLLTYVQKYGTLQLVLRPPQEADAYALPSASWEYLIEYLKDTQGISLGGDVKKADDTPQKKSPPPMDDIQIFKAGQEVIRRDGSR